MSQEILIREIASVKEKIAKIRTETALVFPLFSDLHTSAADAEPAQRLVAALHSISESIRPDAVIDLGDNLSMLGRDKHITNTELAATLTALFDSMYQNVACPLFLINGNHDAIGTDFFKPALWNSIAKGKYDDGKAHYAAAGAYYYVDYDHTGTRLVFLSLPHDSDLTAVNPTPCWAFGEQQLRWLREEALNTDYAVLLFTHVPFYYRDTSDERAMLEVWDGEKTAMSTLRSLCGWIDDVEEAAAIIKAAGNVVACFSGHIHEDSLWMSYEQKGEDKNPLSCPQVVTRSPIPYSHTEEQLGISIDILVWDPAEKKAHIIRFGDGEDRLVSPDCADT